jgi:Kef-type K+ transport system membrane component KefB
LRGSGVLLGLALASCFAAAAAAQVAGLAPIVGAFAAGLVLERAHYEPFVQKGERPLEELMAPVSHVLAPIFFLRMGTQVDLGALVHPGAAALCAALVVAAVVGKQLCMLGVVDPGIRRLPVGLGMIPRGEVGLVFAAMGAAMTAGGKPVLDDAAFAAIVGVVVLTTLLTPPLLAISLRRS